MILVHINGHWLRTRVLYWGNLNYEIKAMARSVYQTKNNTFVYNEKINPINEEATKLLFWANGYDDLPYLNSQEIIKLYEDEWGEIEEDFNLTDDWDELYEDETDYY